MKTKNTKKKSDQRTKDGTRTSDSVASVKVSDLGAQRNDAMNAELRTNQGVPIADNQNSLRAGTRGPTLLEDFILREKIFHFDHERIPERIVHAGGSAAQGSF